MVSKEVVKPTTIDGKGPLEVLSDHTWILNVPGWPTPSNLCIPANRISFPASMPEDKIPQVPLNSRIRILMKSPLLGGPFGHVKPKELSKPGELQGVEVDISAMPVCYLQLEEMLYDPCSLVNGLRGLGKVIRHLHPQQIHFRHEFLDVFLGKLFQALFAPFSLFERLVLDVGEIHPPLNRIARIFQVSNQNVLKQEGPEVSDVRPLVDRGATGEDGNHLIVYRPKWFNPLSEGVKELQQGPCPFLSSSSLNYEGPLPTLSGTHVTYSTKSKNLTTGIARD